MTKTSTGKPAELWVGEGYPIIEIYAGDTLTLEKRRRGLGAEPMTCTPNAFASGDGLTTLEHGRSDYMLRPARLT
jgi:aldose 1-epimerase